MTGIPNVFSNLPGPMPDNCKSCGDWIAPALRMTSRLAMISMVSPSTRTRTPSARLFRMMIFSTSTLVRTVRFGRFMAGFRNALAALLRHRRPIER